MPPSAFGRQENSSLPQKPYSNWQFTSASRQIIFSELQMNGNKKSSLVARIFFIFIFSCPRAEFHRLKYEYADDGRSDPRSRPD